jgi:polyphosphate kinase
MNTPRYFNRELSLLDFQERVLAIAENPSIPLLERVKFVAIVASNLDEFFQVRVGGLAEQKAAGVRKLTPDKMTAAQQLGLIRERCLRLLTRSERVLHRELFPALEESGIWIVGWEGLTRGERAELRAMFEQQVYPVLTPLAFDPSHPFPFISNLSLNLAVSIRNPKTGEGQFARVKVPALLPRFLKVSGDDRFVAIEEVIAAHLDTLFPGMEILGHYPFRVTRSADQAVEEDEAEDLLEAMEEMLHTRQRFSRVVRLQIDDSMPAEIRDLLITEMRIDPSGVYVYQGPLALADLWVFYGLDYPELKDPPWDPVTQPGLVDDGDLDIFRSIRSGDLMVHLPYDSFPSSIGAFIARAARDRDVVAIKQTLYRTSDPVDPAVGGELSIVKALTQAARAGKQVVVLVELKARFDEEANINWARMLEEAGVHVVYGVAGLKTHAKIALVVRREGEELRRYSHIGTGNYNPNTARIYEDLGLLTAHPDFGADLSELFNVLTGYSRQKRYRKLLVAPIGLRKRIVKLIRDEAAKGSAGRIVWKLNHLVDPEIIDELYAASQAGAEVDLVVRGICCLRPQVSGLSERIRVRSIVGEFLEHSRIFKFGAGSEATYLIGSADMMQRNLNGRVEAITPIEDPVLRERLEEILSASLADDCLAWELSENGTWTKRPTERGMHLHDRFKQLAQARAGGSEPDAGAAATPEDVVVAAGGLVTRKVGDVLEVLLVHRPNVRLRNRALLLPSPLL